MPTVGDNPIKKGDDDRLERRAGAANLARDIREVDAVEGYVLGIVGPWGSGKTSVINMIREFLADEPALVCVDFNPWVFSGTDDLVQAFFREISAQLKVKSDQLADVAKTIDTYGDLLAPVTLLPFVGAWFSRLRGASKVYAELHEKRRGSINEQRGKVAERLAHLETPIVVVIDDIDRLESSEIRDIFKLVRLTASFPNIVYVLAFDRQRVEEALTQSGFDGRAYLEKIIQLGWDVPAVPDSVLLRQLGEGLQAGLDDLDIPERFNEDAWPDVLMEIVRPLIKNMRDVRRYAATVRSKARTLQGQVELVDIMGLEAIRLFLPQVFQAIVDGRAGLTTTSSGYAANYQDEVLKQQVLAILEECQSQPRVVRALIERLFPAGLRHIGGTNYGSDWLHQWLMGRRVAHPDVLAAYLEHVANDSMQAFGLAEQAFSLLEDEEKLEELLRGYEIAKLQDAVAALEAFQDDYPATAVVPASRVLLNLMPDLPERPQGMLSFTDTRLVVSRVVLRLLRRLDTPEQVMAAVTEILPAIHALTPKLELIRLVGYLEGAGHKLVSEEDARILEQGLREEIEAASPEQLATEQELLRLLYTPKQWKPGSVIHVDPAHTGLAAAVLLGSRSVVRSQAMGNRAVRRTTRLHWDVLVEIFDGEENLKMAIDNIRTMQGDDLTDAIELADRYLAGWRPSEWGDDGD
jgi:predicted KAP-like P-loop ATPase